MNTAAGAAAPAGQGGRHYLMVAHGGDGLVWERDVCSCTRIAAGGEVQRLYRAFLRRGVLLPVDELPPADRPLEVLPHFLQSGIIVRERLPQAVRDAYAARNEEVFFNVHPVLGSDPFLVRQVQDAVLSSMEAGDALLLLAHGNREGGPPPPEPGMVLDRLLDAAAVKFGVRPGGAVAFFDGGPDVAEILPRLKAERVAVLPYLMAAGMHARENMPGGAEAAAAGRELLVLPPVGVLFRQASMCDVLDWRG